MVDKCLLVGVNAYPDAPLSGCVNDVKDMAGYLVAEHGFAPSSIRMLVDKRATTAAIIERLHWLVKDAKPNDRIVFHHSCHGTQVATRNPQDEIDGKDEVLCPVDFDWSEKHLIRDKALHEIFSRLPNGVKFVWIADCCHSGSLDRDITRPPKGAKKGKVLGARFLAPPADIEWRLKGADHLGHVASKLHARTTSSPLNVAFISGCKDTQTSADATFGNRANGALTYYLLKNLKAKKDLPLTDLVKLVRADLKKNGYSQEPQVDGTRAGVAFLG